MPSNLQNFKAAIQTLWEAVTPEADGSSSTYQFIDTLAEETDMGAHRELVWNVAREAETIIEIGESVRWRTSCDLFLHLAPPQASRTRAAFVAAAENEAQALRAAFNATPTLGAGVDGAVLTRTRLEPTEPTRAVKSAGPVNKSTVIRVTFEFQVDCQEV